MPVFFNGRLWTSPAVVSMVDDSAMANRNLAVGNVLALIGESEGGEPLKAMRFGSPQQARAVLRSGELLTAVERAFAPGQALNGPATVVAMRVNPAVQASKVLTGSSLDGYTTANVMTLKSTDYGLWTNQIRVRVESGSEIGKRLTTQVVNDYYSQDNVHRRAFSVAYTGTHGPASVDVTDSTVTLTMTGNSTEVAIDLEQFPTIARLVDRINAETGWAAEVLDGNDQRPALAGLDRHDDVAVAGTAVVIRADLQACVDWFNSTGEGYVTATRTNTNSNGYPLKNLSWTYLSGGSDGTLGNTDWSDAFVALQVEDVQWVVPLTSSADIHAMADAHCVFMSNISRMERRAFVGGAAAQTLDEVKAAAKLISSDRTAQVYPGYYEYNDAGTLTLYPSYMTAAMVAAGFASLNPGATMTNKTLTVRGLEYRLRNPTDTDDLIDAGVLCVEDVPAGYRVVKAISTWRQNSNYNRVEVSVGFATDYTARTVREALQRFVGEKGSPNMIALTASAAETALRELSRPEPAGPGILVGDANSPPYKNIQVSLEGDVMRVEFQCSPVIPINYIPITIHIVPYSGQVVAASAAGAIVGLSA